MRKLATMIVIFVLSTLPLTGEAHAQGLRWRGGGGWGTDGQYARLYDTNTVDRREQGCRMPGILNGANAAAASVEEVGRLVMVTDGTAFAEALHIPIDKGGVR